MGECEVNRKLPRGIDTDAFVESARVDKDLCVGLGSLTESQFDVRFTADGVKKKWSGITDLKPGDIVSCMTED
jgi:hypothetical protein